jgi:hypothetical protein
MGNLKQLDRYTDADSGLTDEEVHLRLNELKSEIRRSWEDYKRFRAIMYNEKLTDNSSLMLAVYLIKRRIL